MAQPVIRVQGARELRGALKRAGLSLADLKAANAKVAAMVAGLSRPRAPRRSGRLASTGRGNTAVSKATVLYGNAAVVYGGPLHWGWPAHPIAANPWVSETAQDSESQWLPVIAGALDDLVNRIERESL
jgi:hypothetical protein